MNVPGPWAALLLTLAAYRVWRLISRDTITEPVRAALTYPDDSAVTLGHDTEGITIIGVDDDAKPLRVYLSTMLRCPWCMGFYVSVAAWALWLAWPHAAVVAAVPLAISAVVGLVGKLD